MNKIQVGDLVRFRDHGDDTEFRRNAYPYMFEIGIVISKPRDSWTATTNWPGETYVMFPSETCHFITDMLEVISERT